MAVAVLGARREGRRCRRAFVLRELGASSGERREADLHHDVAFVAAQAALKRGRGPLVSLFLWSLRGGVLFIGKADDDIYCHVTGVAAHLRQSLLTVPRGHAVSDAAHLLGRL